MSNSANLYPFVTKAQIKAQLDASPEYRKKAMCILLALQTEHEQATEQTVNKNRQGFMSSHAVHGTRIAKKIKAGEELTSDDWSKIDSIAPRYTRQLAVYFRAQAIVENPALKAVAGLFSAAPKGAPAPVVEQDGPETDEPTEA